MLGCAIATPFGTAGRARCVEDIAERVGVGRGSGERSVVEFCGFRAQAVDDQRRYIAVGEPVGEPEMGDGQRRPGVGEDEPDAIRRMVGVEGDISRPGLQERKQRDIGVDAAIEEDRDAVARPHSVAHEQSRHLIGPRVQFAVADVRALGRDGNAVGVAAARLLEHVAEALAVTPSKRRSFAEDGRRPRLLGPAERGQGVVFERWLAQSER